MRPSNQQPSISSSQRESEGSKTGSCFQKTGESSGSFGRDTSIGASQRDEQFSEFDWATHLHLCGSSGVFDFTQKLINSNLDKISAALIYTEHPQYAHGLQRNLNNNHARIAKQVNSWTQIAEAFFEKSNKVKLFILLANKDIVKSLSQSHYVPNFVDLVINMKALSAKTIQEYEWMIRKRVKPSQQMKYYGLVVNIFNSQNLANEIHSILIKRNLQSKVLNINQAKLVLPTQYFRTEMRTPKKQIELEKCASIKQINKPGYSGEQKAENLQDIQKEYGWATFLQVSITNANRSEKCGKYINANKNNFHSCVVYTFTEGRGNQIIGYLNEDLRNCASSIQITSKKPFKKEYFENLKNGSLRVLIVCIEKGQTLSDWKLPSNVDFIINEESTSNITQNQNRIQRQNNDRVVYNGVVLNFYFYFEEKTAVSQFANKNKVKIEEAPTNNWCLENWFNSKQLAMIETKTQPPIKDTNVTETGQAQNKKQVENNKNKLQSQHSSEDQREKQQKKKQSQQEKRHQSSNSKGIELVRQQDKKDGKQNTNQQLQHSQVSTRQAESGSTSNCGLEKQKRMQHKEGSQQRHFPIKECQNTVMQVNSQTNQEQANLSSEISSKSQKKAINAQENKKQEESEAKTKQGITSLKQLTQKEEEKDCNKDSNQLSHDEAAKSSLQKREQSENTEKQEGQASDNNQLDCNKAQQSTSEKDEKSQNGNKLSSSRVDRATGNPQLSAEGLDQKIQPKKEQNSAVISSKIQSKSGQKLINQQECQKNLLQKSEENTGVEKSIQAQALLVQNQCPTSLSTQHSSASTQISEKPLSNNFEQIKKEQEQQLTKILQKTMTEAKNEIVGQVKAELKKLQNANKEENYDSNQSIAAKVEELITPQLQAIKQIKTATSNTNSQVAKNGQAAENAKASMESSHDLILKGINARIPEKIEKGTQNIIQKLESNHRENEQKLNELLDLQTSVANENSIQFRDIKEAVEKSHGSTDLEFKNIYKQIEAKSKNVIEQQVRAIASCRSEVNANIKQARKQVKDLSKKSAQDAECLKVSLKNNHSLVYGCVNEAIPKKIDQCRQAIADTSNSAKELLTQMLSKQDNIQKYLQTSIASQRQQLSTSTKSITSSISENTNKIIADIESKQKLIKQKRDQQQKQQQEILRNLNQKHESKEQSTAQLQLTLSTLLLQNQKNVEQLKQLKATKAESVRINKQTAELKDQLRKQKLQTKQLTKQINELKEWKQQYTLTLEHVNNEYTNLSQNNEAQKKKLAESQQARSQLESKLAALQKDVDSAKEQIMLIAGFRGQQKPSSSIEAPRSKIVANQGLVMKAMGNELQKMRDIQSISMTETIKKYISVEKKGSDKLKPLLQKAISKTVKKQDAQLISQLQQFRSIKANLAETCRTLSPGNLVVLFNKVILKLIEHCDTTKVYQNDLYRYCSELEKSLSSLSDKILATFTNGDQCSLAAITDHSKKESVVSSSFKNICKNVNEFKVHCNKITEELKKSNKQNADLMKANEIQAGIVLKLQASKKETQAKLTNCEIKLAAANAEIERLKSSLQNVRNELAKKTLQFQTTEKNYLSTIASLNQQIQKSKKALEKLQSDLETQKKSAINAANEAARQLERMKRNATEGMNRLRDDVSKLQQKISNNEKQYKRKYQQQAQTNSEQKKKAISDTKDELTIIHNNQINSLTDKHNTAMDQLKKELDGVEQRLKAQSNKIAQNFQSLNSTLSKITNIRFSFTFENFMRTLGELQNSLNEKYGRILFMPESPMYKAMKPEDKKFIYDNIVRATNKRISHTETLYTFHNTVGDTWAKWRERILDRPNLLVILTLTNGWKIGAFSENPYSQTDKWQSGKGYLMSITNKRCYDVKKLYEGKVARFAPFAIIFGNNELIIQDTQNFSILMNKMNLHFVTNGDRSIDFIGMKETEEGEFTEIQFHQVVFEVQ